ncbi:MAG: hypothetical protein HOE90_03275 [Bacteriovoracaceae bacterium]|jgi:hypothetical protein|nr:hypothetical protein [Bacteriovoracaceae bacterium]
MNTIQTNWPEYQQMIYEFLISPLTLVKWSLTGSEETGFFMAKVMLLTLPLIFLSVAVFSSVLSAATLLFRGQRNQFIGILIITWWDGGKAVINYWAGLVKSIFLSIGWFGAAIRMVVFGLFQTLKDLLFMPMTLMGNVFKEYAKPGIPWLAVMITIGWIALESTMFSYILTPMVGEIMTGLTGTVVPQLILMPGIALFLFLVIGGSFACMHGLVEAVEKKQPFNVAKMLLIEFFIMFIEVMFFYREFVDSLAPWLAQMSNEAVQLGLGSILGIATMAWMGIRFATWFFFAKFGTPTLLSIISREGIFSNSKTSKAQTVSMPLSWIKQMFSSIQNEMNWFTKKSEELVQALMLPPIQILAVMTNFVMILLTGKYLFNLPIKSLSELKDTKEMTNQVKMFQQREV